MLIDMTPILTGRVKSVDFAVNEPYECTGDYASLPSGITLLQPISVVGTVTDNSGYLTLRATVKVTYSAACDRCLEEVEESFELPLHRIVALSDKLGKSKAIEDGVDEDDLIYARGENLNITSTVYEELSLNLPEYHLCREDCPGLCPTCGKKKDSGCGCSTDFKKEIDPRWEKLKKLLENSEEK